eukprot:m51a1_g6835 hypothetical protein (333) ;mRNA; r:55690-56813
MDIPVAWARPRRFSRIFYGSQSHYEAVEATPDGRFELLRYTGARGRAPLVIAALARALVLAEGPDLTRPWSYVAGTLPGLLPRDLDPRDERDWVARHFESLARPPAAPASAAAVGTPPAYAAPHPQGQQPAPRSPQPAQAQRAQGSERPSSTGSSGTPVSSRPGTAGASSRPSSSRASGSSGAAAAATTGAGAIAERATRTAEGLLAPWIEAARAELPTRDQRTKRLIALGVAALLAFALVCRYSSAGLFVVAVVAAEYGYVWAVVHRRELLKRLAKHKVTNFRRRVAFALGYHPRAAATAAAAQDESSSSSSLSDLSSSSDTEPRQPTPRS